MAITGVNHITLAVTDLDRSVAFYRDRLGLRLRAVWSEGAYLTSGALWLCLSLAPRVDVRGDYSHIAFDVSEQDFPLLVERLGVDATLWQDNVSEGASTYLLDPDGHKLELHVGGIDARLDHYRKHPEKGVTVLD
ncbi:VOC family protein [Maritimibacter sp. DP1N21-5]|uniref:VOC family protein n=1 Tax=Maritimibacter sp. DP1N21-5 TaxID=2836867 RepID=UPI001C481B28|nr:VOC family protein [Maritimibacter sp. DP1N21-5]MBV7408373.1 VOC family protein [Maritimibacter sp. DP1N21-5]